MKEKSSEKPNYFASRPGWRASACHEFITILFSNEYTIVSGVLAVMASYSGVKSCGQSVSWHTTNLIQFFCRCEKVTAAGWKVFHAWVCVSVCLCLRVVFLWVLASLKVGPKNANKILIVVWQMVGWRERWGIKEKGKVKVGGWGEKQKMSLRCWPLWSLGLPSGVVFYAVWMEKNELLDVFVWWMCSSLLWRSFVYNSVATNKKGMINCLFSLRCVT